MRFRAVFYNLRKLNDLIIVCRGDYTNTLFQPQAVSCKQPEAMTWKIKRGRTLRACPFLTCKSRLLPASAKHCQTANNQQPQRGWLGNRVRKSLIHCHSLN